MSLPPYVPPTEEEFIKLHERLSRALIALDTIGRHVGLSNAERDLGQVVRRVLDLVDFSSGLLTIWQLFERCERPPAFLARGTKQHSSTVPSQDERSL